MSLTSKAEADFTVGRVGTVSRSFRSIPVVSAATLLRTGMSELVSLRIVDGVGSEGTTYACRCLRVRGRVGRQLRWMNISV